MKCSNFILIRCCTSGIASDILVVVVVVVFYAVYNVKKGGAKNYAIHIIKIPMKISSNFRTKFF